MHKKSREKGGKEGGNTVESTGSGMEYLGLDIVIRAEL